VKGIEQADNLRTGRSRLVSNLITRSVRSFSLEGGMLDFIKSNAKMLYYLREIRTES